MSAPIRLATLAELRDALRKLRTEAATAVTPPNASFSLHQLLVHCAQSIEYSLTGYPQMKPAWLRATVRLVRGRFLARGAMRHNLTAPVPGAPALPREGDMEAAWARLLAALDRFEAHTEPLRDHFMFGRLTKAEYERIHAMHLADHLNGRQD